MARRPYQAPSFWAPRSHELRDPSWRQASQPQEPGGRSADHAAAAFGGKLCCAVRPPVIWSSPRQQHIARCFTTRRHGTSVTTANYYRAPQLKRIMERCCRPQLGNGRPKDRQPGDKPPKKISTALVVQTGSAVGGIANQICDDTGWVGSQSSCIRPKYFRLGALLPMQSAIPENCAGTQHEREHERLVRQKSRGHYPPMS